MWSGRLWVLGLAAIFPAYALWLGHNFLPSLAATRTVATAAVSVEKGPEEVQLQHAFATAKSSVPVEATLALQTHPALPGAYTLAVTADTEEQAKAGIATLAKALTAAFPKAERNLYLSLNHRIYPAPNATTERIYIAVIATMVLLMLAGQLMLVVGSRIEGSGRAGMIAAIATPFTILIFPTSGTSSGHLANPAGMADWQFVVLLLALTPIAVILGILLTRKIPVLR